MSKTSKRKSYFRSIGYAVAALLMVAGVMSASVGSASAASTALVKNPKRYCRTAAEKNCLQPLTVTVTNNCVREGGKIHFNFSNPNAVIVPRAITVYFNGEEFFGDDDFLVPGENPTLTYGPLPNGEWRVVVSSYDRVFADEKIPFSCLQ